MFYQPVHECHLCDRSPWTLCSHCKCPTCQKHLHFIPTKRVSQYITNGVTLCDMCLDTTPGIGDPEEVMYKVGLLCFTKNGLNIGRTVAEAALYLSKRQGRFGFEEIYELLEVEKLKYLDLNREELVFTREQMRGGLYQVLNNDGTRKFLPRGLKRIDDGVYEFAKEEVHG